MLFKRRRSRERLPRAWHLTPGPGACVGHSQPCRWSSWFCPTVQVFTVLCGWVPDKRDDVGLSESTLDGIVQRFRHVSKFLLGPDSLPV